jgi:hypothetical protein
MKLKAILLAVFAAGVLASIAIAKPPPGKGHNTVSTTGTTATSTTTTTGKGKAKGKAKVNVCHKLPNGHYVLLRVSVQSAHARIKHEGDVLATNGTCPGPIQGKGGKTTTASTTTTAATTTS